MGLAQVSEMVELPQESGEVSITTDPQDMPILQTAILGACRCSVRSTDTSTGPMYWHIAANMAWRCLGMPTSSPDCGAARSLRSSDGAWFAGGLLRRST